MVTFDPNSSRQNTLGIDRVKLRLLVLGLIVMAMFLALFSRLWFLQVLASDDFRALAKDNRVRKVHTEPPRGRILDRNGVVLVDNFDSLSVTVDRQVVKTPRQEKRILNRLSKLLNIEVKDLKERLHAPTVSPYKPVAVANDVSEGKIFEIEENPEDFPGVDYEQLPIRKYPEGPVAPHILGWLNEINTDELKSDFAKGARPPYQPGDIVGKDGVERTYDRVLRERPGVQKVIVNSRGKVVSSEPVVQEEKGNDLILTIDARIQKLTERALADGVAAARGAGYAASTAGVVVMDPTNGDVISMASFPTYDPEVFADGITDKEYDALGAGTLDIPEDDALTNRVIQGGFPPGSTYKIVTAGAAMWTGVADISTVLGCPPSATYPPEGGPGSVTYNNWTSIDFGSVGFARSLEISCDTFYYELGWRMEDLFGPIFGDGTERFQRYARITGFDHETGIDLPNEFDGRVPDEEWCLDYREQTDGALCPDGWLPGYTVNMSIGQGDLVVTPLQMAVAFAAIANGGDVVVPRVAMAYGRQNEDGQEEILKQYEPEVAVELPLDDAEIAVMHEGLIDVISGPDGTAAGAFAGFPLDEFPLAGKTGTAQIGETDKNFAWFVSYGPADDARYVIAVYVEKAGHGGESAGPIARQIWEGIFGIDEKTEVHLGTDASG